MMMGVFDFSIRSAANACHGTLYKVAESTTPVSLAKRLHCDPVLPYRSVTWEVLSETSGGGEITMRS